jgi:hypothetical protein
MIIDKDGLYSYGCELYSPILFKIGDVVDIIVYDPSRHAVDLRGKKAKIESFTRDGLVYVTNCDASGDTLHACIFGQACERTDIKPVITSKQSNPDSESCPDEPCIDCKNEKTEQCNSCFPVNGHKSKFDRKESNNHVTNWNACKKNGLECDQLIELRKQRNADVKTEIDLVNERQRFFYLVQSVMWPGESPTMTECITMLMKINKDAAEARVEWARLQSIDRNDIRNKLPLTCELLEGKINDAERADMQIILGIISKAKRDEAIQRGLPIDDDHAQEYEHEHAWVDYAESLQKCTKCPSVRDTLHGSNRIYPSLKEFQGKDSKKSDHSLQFYCTSCSDGIAIDLDRLVDIEGTLTCPTCHCTNFFRVKKSRGNK